MRAKRGFTLIETIVFLVVVSIGMLVLLRVFSQSLNQSVDPVMRLKSVEKAQALMDDILARKFAENTPTGGVPACGSVAFAPCAAIAADSDYDDVGDFHGYVDGSDAGYTVTASVVPAGTDLGLALANARLITVIVTMPDGASLTLAAYKVNF